MTAQRLDVWLVEQGYFPSRQRAQGAIMAGRVLVNGVKVDKAGYRVPPGAAVEVKPDPLPFVSRGGLKLNHALDVFGVDPAGRVALDAGASTGGFVDCLLSRGAALVYAVDVGYGQLDWRLRNDPRVRVMERTNLRHLDPAELDPRPDLITLDLSFISLTLVLPNVARCLQPRGEVLPLVKPQFEAGRQAVGKGGIVRDPAVHREVLHKVAAAAQGEGFQVWGVTPSPILGADGNREFFLWLRRGYASEEGQGPLAGEAWEQAVLAVTAEDATTS
ncbi:MAG TPA: TlyA family RNA methyltransferase [Sphingobacteriaceae bacterium]|nr:TlyA family RNA methyltransferase [Sphingobacteriaceae bacterium]